MHSCFFSNANSWEDFGSGIPISGWGHWPGRSRVGLGVKSPDSPLPGVGGHPIAAQTFRGLCHPSVAVLVASAHSRGATWADDLGRPKRGRGWPPTLLRHTHAPLPQFLCSLQPQRGEEAISVLPTPRSPKKLRKSLGDISLSFEICLAITHWTGPLMRKKAVSGRVGNHPFVMKGK